MKANVNVSRFDLLDNDKCISPASFSRSSRILDPAKIKGINCGNVNITNTVRNP